MTDFDRTDSQHRPPRGDSHAPTGKPLIVTPTFVSRVDGTPRGERPQEGGSAKSPHGHEVRFRNWRAGALALESDPNFAFEHWDEYWRKVHGPKFAWDKPGGSSAKVLRYDQVHHVASGASSGFPPPYRAMVNESGRLPSDHWRHVPEFRRPRWDGLAYIAYAEEDEIEATLGQEKFAKRIIADEQTTFRMVAREITRERGHDTKVRRPCHEGEIPGSMDR